MDQMPLNVLYSGKNEPLPVQHILHAGPVTVMLEEGRLRQIRIGQREIVRHIYVAVRDRYWSTPQPVISNVQIDDRASSFLATFDARVQEGDIDFLWRCTIAGDEQGTITFGMDGEALSTFYRGRLGICVLHPIETCAGQPYTVTHPNGVVDNGSFPLAISPHQPVMDIKAISYQVAPGVTAEIGFEGEVFEMEDQRNWSDASFKTYSTPLALPQPVEVMKGTHVQQQVTIRLTGSMPEETPRPEPTTVTVIEGALGPMPRIGLGLPASNQPLSDKEVLRLRALRLSHLRVDLTLSDTAYAEALRLAAQQSQALRIPLEVALFVSDAAEQELASLAELVASLKPKVWAWLVFHQAEKVTEERWLRLARQYLASYDPEAKFGGGSNIYFTEINREHPPLETVDLVCYPVNPQVHTFDNLSMVENLPGEGWQVANAKGFSDNRPVIVSPVTLGSQPNPNSARSAVTAEGLSVAVDTRQMSLFGAAWTVGSLKYLAESGVYSVTYYQTIGPEGVMERESGSPDPEVFPSLPGAAFPLYHVIGDAGAFAGGEALGAISSRPLLVDALAMAKGARRRLLVANMTGEPQTVTLQGVGQGARVKWVDERNASEAMEHPGMCRAQACEELLVPVGELEMELLPYAFARIDWETGTGHP